MSIVVNVNGESINYPQTGDTNWGDEATDFAVQTSSALAKVGLSTGTTVDLPGTLDVTGNTTLDANLSVGGTTSLTGNVTLTNNLTVNGNETVGGTLGVTSDITTSGILTASNSTNVTTAPPITFTGDTNTGIGRSGADTLDFITNGNSRFRIESTGQIKAVYESQVGTDYNTQLDNGYFCRAWVNFNGTGTVAIRASGNVSSITDNNPGDYTVNFTTAMPDSNFCPVSIGSQNVVQNYPWVPTLIVSNSPFSVNSLRLSWEDTVDGASIDVEFACVAVFR